MNDRIADNIIAFNQVLMSVILLCNYTEQQKNAKTALLSCPITVNKVRDDEIVEKLWWDLPSVYFYVPEQKKMKQMFIKADHLLVEKNHVEFSFGA